MPVKQILEASGYEVGICTFEAGEAHKRAETYVAILEFVAEHELSRSDVIVALGGGVVGDVDVYKRQVLRQCGQITASSFRSNSNNRG